MQYLTIGNINASLDIPPLWRERIGSHLSPFLSAPQVPADAFFSTEQVEGPISLDGAVKRNMVYYRENGTFDFDLLTPDFRLHIDLNRRKGSLYMAPLTEYTSIIYNAIKWFMTFVAIHDGGVPLHSSLVTDGQDGVLFSGPSGSGKTTIARLCTEAPALLQQGSDELNFIFTAGRKTVVAPTPFLSSGSACRFTGSKSLQRIFFLRHASRHSIKMLDLKRSFHELLKNMYSQPGPRILNERLLSSLEKIAVSVPCGVVSFNNDLSVGEFFTSEWMRFHAPALQS